MSAMNDQILGWRRESGVRVDHKGRLIVTLPINSVDDFASTNDDEVPSIADLMRHDVNLHLGGSKGHRRRRAQETKRCRERTVRADSPVQSTRIGRPTIGAEVRVYVQTSIATRTREILVQNELTLAEIFDAYARELAHVC